MLNLEPNEETFEVRPIGIKYKCPFCGEGEMVANTEAPIVTANPQMFPHVCNKCGKTMLLPKVYPFVIWEAKLDQPADVESNTTKNE